MRSRPVSCCRTARRDHRPGRLGAPAGGETAEESRVADLASLIATLRDESCNVLEKTDDSEYGKFGWVIDPEGNKIELWQPPEGQ